MIGLIRMLKRIGYECHARLDTNVEKAGYECHDRLNTNVEKDGMS